MPLYLLLLIDILGSFHSLPRVIQLWSVGDRVSPRVAWGQGTSVIKSRRGHFHVFHLKLQNVFLRGILLLTKHAPSLLYVRYFVKDFVQVKVLKIALFKIQSWVCYFKEPPYQFSSITNTFSPQEQKVAPNLPDSKFGFGHRFPKCQLYLAL